jgi:hypothetical protein
MFSRLIVWQKSMELAEDVYRLTSTFPSSEIYGLVSQTDKEFKQFLYIARGSVFELRTQLELARRLNFIDSDIVLKDKILEVQKMLNILINRL